MRRLAVLSLAVALLVVGCADDGDEGATTTTTVASSDGTTAPADEGEAAGGTRLVVGEGLAERYCEVLAVTTTEAGLEAEVWGTQALNDCPQAAFDAIDPAAAAEQLGADLAVKNGPRFWVLDAIVGNGLAGSGEVETLGGMAMRSIAIVELEASMADRSPFVETSVRRNTEFEFDAGTEVYELTAPDGSVYVMQSWTVEVDPDLTADDLAGLGGRLELPDGWTFTTRVLDQVLVVEDVDGIATVVQDELHNTYQLRQRG